MARKIRTAATADSATLRLCQQVRQLRKSRQWTLQQLSAASGVSRSMLSQIERQQVNPTFHVAYRIARAFGVSLGELVDQPQAAPTIEVIRAHDEQYHFRKDPHHSVRTLSPIHLEKEVEFYEVRLQPGAALRSLPHLAGTREFLTVHKGRVCVISGQAQVELAAGDSARFPADVRHAIENRGRGEAVAFLVAVYRSPT